MVYQILGEILNGKLIRAVHEYEEIKDPTTSSMISIVRDHWSLRVSNDSFDRVMVNGSYKWIAYTMEKKMVSKLQTEMDSLLQKSLIKLQRIVNQSIHELGSTESIKDIVEALSTTEVSLSVDKLLMLQPEVEVVTIISGDDRTNEFNEIEDYD